MQKLLRRDSIDNSVENSIGHTLGQKLLVYKRLLLDDSVENSIGGRPYPRTEAPSV